MEYPPDDVKRARKQLEQHERETKKDAAKHRNGHPCKLCQKTKVKCPLPQWKAKVQACVRCMTEGTRCEPGAGKVLLQGTPTTGRPTGDAADDGIENDAKPSTIDGKPERVVLDEHMEASSLTDGHNFEMELIASTVLHPGNPSDAQSDPSDDPPTVLFHMNSDMSPADISNCRLHCVLDEDPSGCQICHDMRPAIIAYLGAPINMSSFNYCYAYEIKHTVERKFSVMCEKGYEDSTTEYYKCKVVFNERGLVEEEASQLKQRVGHIIHEYH